MVIDPDPFVRELELDLLQEEEEEEEEEEEDLVPFVRALELDLLQEEEKEEEGEKARRSQECARTVPTSIRAHTTEQPNSAEALEARKKKSRMKRENNKEEVSLLSGILYYFKKMGRYPFENLVTVNHFICTLPYIRGTPTEVRSKIQKLRKKYKKLWKKHGDKLMIMDPLCNEALQLWKEIWGKKPTDDQQQQQSDIDLSEQPDMDLSMFPFLRESIQSDHANPSLKVLPQTIVSEALAQLESSEMQQFDEEWREIQRKEMELYWRRVSIIKDPLCNEAFQPWKEIWGKKPTDDQQQQQQQQPDMELSEQPDMDLSMFPFLRESMQSDHANPSLKVLPQTIVSEALAQSESSEMQQFDGEWREIQRKEMELYWRRVSIIKNQTQRLLDLVPNHQTQGDDEPVDDQDPDEV